MSWLGAFFDRSAAVVVATARVVFACFSLLAIWLDPTQPDRYPPLTYGILALYVAHAFVVAAWQAYSRQPVMLAHWGDVLLIGVLIYLTQGPTSPFFVLVTFAMISGSLQWGARGALATGAALVVIQIGVTAIDGVAEIDRFIMRSGYLIVGACLFAYYGAYRDRTRERFAQLAAWPAEDVTSGEFPKLGRSLAHAADVIKCREVVVMWTGEHEPLVFMVGWGAGEQQNSTAAAAVLEGGIAAEVADMPFVADSAPERDVIMPKGVVRTLEAPISASLRDLLQMKGRVASAPFKTATASGRLFCANPSVRGDELFVLLEIVADHIGNEIHEYQLRVQLQIAAVTNERARLADDLHDSTLQVMTAASLELQRLTETVNKQEVRSALIDVRNQLSAQQQEIRLLATRLRRGRAQERADEPKDLNQAVLRTLSKIEAIWNCRTHAEVVPQPAVIAPELQREIEFILMEAAANACRHGKADRLEVAIEVGPSQLSLRIGNNRVREAGAGTAPFPERAGDRIAAPRSIGHRVAVRNGVMNLSDALDRFELDIRLPLTCA